MEKPIEEYWKKRLMKVKKALEDNNFDVFIADSAAEAQRIVLKEVLPKVNPKSVSWGGSMTFTSCGLYDAIRGDQSRQVLDTFEKKLPDTEKMEIRRRSLLVDLFITGTNALTETGKLVNLDMYGNRVAAITFGPQHVLILVGRNKIVPDIHAAMSRVKNYAAPVNAMRLDKKTPCAKTASCEDCMSPDRICNTWTITEKSFPKGRVKVVLINEDLGF